MEWTEHKCFKLIGEYEKHPLLWQAKHTQYYNKYIKKTRRLGGNFRKSKCRYQRVQKSKKLPYFFERNYRNNANTKYIPFAVLFDEIGDTYSVLFVILLDVLLRGVMFRSLPLVLVG